MNQIEFDTYYDLDKIIAFLKKYDRGLHVPIGWGEPHSYRGYYEQLAFDPETNTNVGNMLDHAESALGKTFEGYKGGDYTMHGGTDCWIAESHSGGGQLIGEILLRYMVKDFS